MNSALNMGATGGNKSDMESKPQDTIEARRSKSEIDTTEYNFSRRTSLYSSTNGNFSQLPLAQHPHHAPTHGRSRSNSILLEELSQFEHAVWDTLPDTVEEADECEYEEHGSEKTSPTTMTDGKTSGISPSSPYKVGKAQFYSCQRTPSVMQCDLSHLNNLPGALSNHRTPLGKRSSISAINELGFSRWVKQGLFHGAGTDEASSQEDKYYLVKSGTLEQLVEQCLIPHPKLDDPFFQDILLEQYSMFTTKITLANQLMQSTRLILTTNKVKHVSSLKKNHSSNSDETIKEHVKNFIQKWKDDFPHDFQDSDALQVIDTLIALSALINSLHLKTTLERQKRLLNVKVKCFIEPKIEQERKNSECVAATPQTNQKQQLSLKSLLAVPVKRDISQRVVLPNKLQVPFSAPASTSKVGGTQSTSKNRNQSVDNTDPRQVQSLSSRPKKRPVLRSLSNDFQGYEFSLTMGKSNRNIFHTPDATRKQFCPYSAEDVAKQLTFKYSNYLLEMRPFELVQYAQGKLEQDSSLQKIISLNKEIEEKIPSTILSDVLLKSQKIGSIIDFWLRVAEELRELRNYECLQIVVHSLNSPLYDSIRLPEIWSHIDKQQLQSFEKLKETVSIEDNYQILRELQKNEEMEEQEANCRHSAGRDGGQRSLKSALVRTLSRRRESKELTEKHGFIPCINVIKKDILGILAAHQIDKTSNGVIAFAMHRKIHQQLQQIKLAQRLLKRSLQLQHNELIWKWFEMIKIEQKSKRDANSIILSRR